MIPRLAWFLFFGFAASLTSQASGVLVLAGQPRPALRRIEIPAGEGTRFELLLPAQPVAGIDCRFTLYAVGGPVVATLASKTVKLGAIAVVEGSVRVPVDLEIPAAKPRTRFLLKAEKMTGSRRELLAEAEVAVMEQDPVAELRAGAGRIQVVGESKLLREFFSAHRIAVTDDAATGGTDTIVFMEDRNDARLAEHAAVVVVCRETPDSMLGVFAKPGEGKWVVEASLPHFRQLASAAEARIEMAHVFRFAVQLITPPPEASPPP